MASKETKTWSDLPNDILMIVIVHLSSLIDLTSFSSVCKTWRAAASSLSPSQAACFPPLLLIPTLSGDGLLSSLRLVDPANPSFSTSLEHFSIKFKGIYCKSLSCFYSHGCLLRVDKNNKVLILNPFTGDEIFSPVIPPSWLFPRPVLTAPISSADCAVLLACKGELIYWRIGTSSWSSCGSLGGKFNDIVFAAVLQGKVYFSQCENTWVLDLSPEPHLMQLEVELIPESLSYLVECEGEILSLNLVTVGEDGFSARFEVFKLERNQTRLRWVRVSKEALGSWSFFLGIGFAPCIAVKNPEKWGGKSQCIYYATGGNGGGESPWIVVDLGQEICTLDSPLESDASKLSPVWVPWGF